MPMCINNNLAANAVLGEWKKNDSDLAKQLKKVSSGMKITSAKDDASGYAISERMRVQLRSLDQDITNTQNGSSLLHVAEGGIQSIIDELRSLKELAINSANDHNTDQDRATLQKEFDQRSANIDDIANTTNYNGKLLLNGTYAQPRLIGTTGGAPDMSHVKALANLASKPSAVADLASVGTITGTSSYNITKNGLYTLSPSFTGAITIGAGVTNVELAGSGNTNNEVYVTGPASGNLQLILKNYNVNNGQSITSAIRFQGSGNELVFKGTNTITDGSYSIKSATPSAIVNVGQGLTLCGGDANGSGTLNVASSWNTGAIIGSNSGEQSNADIIVSSGTINLSHTKFGNFNSSAGIGSGNDGSIGNIVISGANISVDAGTTVNFNSRHGAGIGSGESGTVKNIYVGNGANIDIVTGSGAGIGSGESFWSGGSSAGDILIEDATITVATSGGAGIGSGEAYSTKTKNVAGNIAIQNSTIHATTYGGAGVGSGTGSGVGIISIDNQSNVSAKVGLGSNGYYTQTITPTVPIYSDEQPLVIHTGTKANQALHIHLESMDLAHLGIDQTKITTRPKAVSALADIDNAIEYALDQQTHVGATISRLQMTAANLTTASENTQASESTIRDADMAKEMTGYTRASVLSQTAQAMLSQANQSASSVLSLLQ